MLADAERNGERAAHLVRGLLWAIVFAASAVLFKFPIEMELLGAAALVVLWALAWLGLSSLRHYRWLRYVLITVDPWLWTASVAVSSGALPAIAGLAPPIFVFLALSGALRLYPRVALLGTGSALLAYAVYLGLVPLDPGLALFDGLLIVVAGVAGMNAARALRGMVVRARTEAVLEGSEALPRELAGTGSLERVGRVEEVTLLLCDIRGFTGLSERLSPAETVTFVNAYLDAVCPQIADAGGVIDKFMGDGVLAFFEGGGHAARALGAARRIIAAVDEATFPVPERVHVGIALHSGAVLVGTVGPRTRREYTVISDAVNTLARLEELNKEYGSLVIASSATIASAPPELRAGFDGPLEVTIRGRDAAVGVHVFGILER